MNTVLIRVGQLGSGNARPGQGAVLVGIVGLGRIHLQTDPDGKDIGEGVGELVWMVEHPAYLR